MPKSVVVVLRRSTIQQDVSLEAQLNDCEQACLSNGWSIRKVYDDSASGSASLDKRPGLVAAMADLKKGEILMARSASRLSRSISLHLAIESEVKRKKAKIFLVDGGLASDDPQHRLLSTLRMAMNEFELAQISFRTRSALKKLAKEGRALGAPKRVRYGFKVSDDGRHLERNEDELRCLSRVKELREEQVKGRVVQAILEREGFRNRLGKPFHLQAIYKMARRLKEEPEFYGI